MTLLAALERVIELDSHAVRGPWKVFENTIPSYLGDHIERTIYTEWDHPQLRGPYPVVCISTGIGPEQGAAPVQFVHISAESAALIIALRNLVTAHGPELLAALRDADRLAYWMTNRFTTIEQVRERIDKHRAETIAASRSGEVGDG